MELTFPASICCHVNPALFKAEIFIGRAKHNTSEICQKHLPCTSSAAYNLNDLHTKWKRANSFDILQMIFFARGRTYPNRRWKAFAVESYSEVLWFGSNLFHDVVEELGLLFLFREDTIQKDQYTVSECPAH